MPWAWGLMETHQHLYWKESRGLEAGRRSAAPRQGGYSWATGESSVGISLKVLWRRGVKDPFAGGPAERTERVKIQRKWCAGACFCPLEEGTVCLSSQFHVQWHHVDSRKSVVVGVFTPQKVANATDQGFLPLKSQVINMGQHATAQRWKRTW